MGEDTSGQYNHLIEFGPGTISALRRRSKDYAIPLDIALLGCLCVAMFRTGVSNELGKLTGKLDGAQLLTMSLYAPMRDSVMNENMVGLFSDWRDVSLAAPAPSTARGGVTVLGMVLELTGLIRNRQWEKFDALQNAERILVNILALDERPRGACGFQQ